MKTKKPGRFRDGKHKPILAGPTVDEYQKIRVAAASQGTSMAQFLIRHGLVAAEKILAKMQK
jgi:uncharacterized protein (DUF1778 family)